MGSVEKDEGRAETLEALELKMTLESSWLSCNMEVDWCEQIELPISPTAH